ncbi:hypothetical protein QBC47DRAFT_420741 [Echria macrotheca]|uniref:DUF4470 domain-containing protein n=1 Tax=Echria macrotheca TaxID=438768 RepID=A0AAJ0BMQ8_9PEZI|nr:hypothetical protein QBC47DRAFT_420741 [Echria macrotheca]
MAETIRKNGNQLYRLGKLTEEAAGVEYEKAAALAPNDPTPLSNLSSVKFELGEYFNSAKYINKAFQLHDTQDKTEASERKEMMLVERLAKCLYSRASTNDILAAASGQDASAHRMLMLDRLPRLMTNLDNLTEYYAIGHDSCSPQDSVALMFCGSGDARNVFTTLVMMGIEEVMQKKQLCKNLHITLVDTNAAAIARTLIFFEMMAVHMVNTSLGTPALTDSGAILAYLYASQVVPAAVQAKLQLHIRGLIHALTKVDKPPQDWLYLPPATRTAVVHVLRRWQDPPRDSSYSSRAIRRTTSIMYGHDRRREPEPGFELDRKSFDDFGVVLPSKGFAERNDRPLYVLMEEYRTGSSAAKQKLAAHIDENWVTNVTMIDFDYSEARNNANDPLYPMFDDEAKVPSIEKVSRAKGALESVGDFLETTAMMIARIAGANRLIVEARVGEMTDVMERLRWDCLDGRSPSPDAEINPAKFPRKYDRIHMSNIPDYIGGLFPVAMYARPLLREKDEANLRFTVLLNPPEFRNHKDFQSEYLVLHDDNAIKNHFAMARIPGYTKGVDNPEGYSHLDSMDFVTEGYIVWQRCAFKKLARGKDLLARPALEKWLHAFFLKICVPFPRSTVTMSPVYTPLNLTAFVRLVAHLSGIGYPAHWLSGILSDLCSGTIKTTARAPRAVITTPEHIDAANPQVEMSTAPWAAELSTLVSIWSPLLKFGLTVPRGLLVAPNEIAEYSVSFLHLRDNSQLRLPHFVLVFWKAPKGGAAPPPGSHLSMPPIFIRRQGLSQRPSKDSDRNKQCQIHR